MISDAIRSNRFFFCEDTGRKALGCPADWTEVIGAVPGHLTQLSCLKLYHDKKSWRDARRICQTAGGDLVSLQTDFMQKAVAGKN